MKCPNPDCGQEDVKSGQPCPSCRQFVPSDDLDEDAAFPARWRPTLKTWGILASVLVAAGLIVYFIWAGTLGSRACEHIADMEGVTGQDRQKVVAACMSTVKMCGHLHDSSVCEREYRCDLDASNMQEAILCDEIVK